MQHPPTIIVLAAPPVGKALAAEDASVPNALEATLRRVLACGLPLLMVAPAATAERARQVLPGNDVVTLADRGQGRSQWLAEAVAAGVQASSRANGWLLLPIDVPVLQTDTLLKMAEALTQHTLVYPQYRLNRGHPLGFSSELYSELIRLENERDLGRLAARYPAVAVDLDDPGVLMPAAGLAAVQHPASSPEVALTR